MDVCTLSTISDQEGLRHAVPPIWSNAGKYMSASVLETLGFKVIIPVSKRPGQGQLATCIGATDGCETDPRPYLTEPQSAPHHLVTA
jgi:hypothetical protein